MSCTEDSFNESLETDMESLKFVIDNMQKIQELVDLRENVSMDIFTKYAEISSKIFTDKFLKDEDYRQSKT